MLMNLAGKKVCARIQQALSMAGVIYLNHPVLADTLETSKAAPYEQCGYCHEYDGNTSMGNYPKLAGQKKQYLIKQLQDYRKGQRDGKGMMEVAASLLSDQDVDIVAEHFSTQKRTLDIATGSTTQFEHAKEICTKGIPARQIIACNLCHQSADTRMPTLSGQHAEYLAIQLHDFKNKTRTNDVATIMQYLAERLTNAEITEISQYLATGDDQ
jgi:cytochrome c553